MLTLLLRHGDINPIVIGATLLLVMPTIRFIL